jgi:putative ABC transport system substrate-binding protein
VKIFRPLLLIPPLLLFLFNGTSLASKNLLVVFSADLPRYHQAQKAFLQAFSGTEKPPFESEEITLSPEVVSGLSALRKKMESRPVMVLTYGALATRTVLAMKPEVPVLFAGLQKAEAREIPALHDPKGIVAGIYSPPMETLVLTAREIREFKRLGVLFSSGNPESARKIKILEELGRKYGFSLIKSDIRKHQNLRDALEAFPGWVNTLFLLDCPEFHPGLNNVLEFSARKFLPLISEIPGLADKGALISLEADPAEEGRLMAACVRHYMNGENAPTLSIRAPRNISFVINLKTARMMNIRIPFSALCRATRVIR